MKLRRGLRAQDDAVSTVVSAVLVFSLLVVVLSVYMSQIVPEQMADAEAAHMRRVATSLGNIAAETSGAVALHREGEFVTQVELGTGTLAGLTMFQSSGTMSVQDYGFFANFLCGAPRLIARDGQAAPGGSFVNLTRPPTTNISELIVLDLKVTSYSFGGSDLATLKFKANSNPGATLELRLQDGSIRVRTYEGDNITGNLVLDQAVQTGLTSVEMFVIQGLDPAYGFSTMLANAQGPFTIETSSTTSQVEAYGVYRTMIGTIGQLGSGRDLASGFQRTVNPAALVFEPRNSKFIDQTYSMEGGAVVLAQETGQYLNLIPFSLTVDPNLGPENDLLTLSLVDLTGAGQVSGSHRVTVSVSVRGPTSSLLECTNPTLLVSSEYPFAWHSAWSDALVNAGLNETWARLSGELLTVRLEGTWNVLLEEARVVVRLT